MRGGVRAREGEVSLSVLAEGPEPAIRRWPSEVKAVKMEAPAASKWARTALGFEADARQAEILDCESNRVLLCCTRQWGKSTVTAVRALYEAWWRPGTLVACVAPVRRQSRYFLIKVKKLLEERLGERPLRDPRADPGDGLSVRLKNGSAVLGLPGNEDTTRGLSAVDFLILDEAARIPDETYHAVRPFLATTGGRLWALSTPDGQAGFFYDEWHDAKAKWTRMSVPATECARIPAAFLEGERRALGEHVFAQEYLCRFLASRSQLVPRGLVDEAVTEGEERLDVSRLFPGG